MNQNSLGWGLALEFLKSSLDDLLELENHCTKCTHVTFKNILAPKGQMTSPKVTSGY